MNYYFSNLEILKFSWVFPEEEKFSMTTDRFHNHPKEMTGSSWEQCLLLSEIWGEQFHLFFIKPQKWMMSFLRRRNWYSTLCEGRYGLISSKIIVTSWDAASPGIVSWRWRMKPADRSTEQQAKVLIRSEKHTYFSRRPGCNFLSLTPNYLDAQDVAPCFSHGII